ncbi:MAG: hypothetical protein ACE5IJ_02070 [Thermoplasmata archaeon]
MEDVSRFPRKQIGSHQLRAKNSGISLKGSAFFEYRWYRILEALHESREELTLRGLVQKLEKMGASPNETLLKEDLTRLEEQDYLESYRESQSFPGKKFRLTRKGIEKVKRVLRKL